MESFINPWSTWDIEGDVVDIVILLSIMNSKSGAHLASGVFSVVTGKVVSSLILKLASIILARKTVVYV